MAKKNGIRVALRLVAILSLLTIYGFALQPVAAQGPPVMDVFKYNDLNGNGVYEPAQGEQGLNNWEFTVEGPANAFGAGISTFSGNTSNGGHLIFTVFAAGLYMVTETPQANWGNTDPGGVAPFRKPFFIPEIIPNQFPDDNQILFGNMQFLPDSITTITAIPPGPLPAGGRNISLRIEEANSGNVRLENPHVYVTSNATAPYAAFDLTKAGGGSPPNTTFSGDTNDNGFLDVGEIFTWVVKDVPITSTVEFEAIGEGIDPVGKSITYPEYTFERDTVTVVVSPVMVPGMAAAGMGLLIVVLGGAISLVVYRRTTRAQQSRAFRQL